jgi:predicted metal-binding protein
VAITDMSRGADDEIETLVSATVYVCITCRRAGLPEGAPREGPALAKATATAAKGTGVSVRRIRCLANCNRGLSAALRRDGAWTYVFGQLDPDKDADALIEGARMLARSPDGLLPWIGRPEILKRGLIARVPPIDYPEEE